MRVTFYIGPDSAIGAGLDDGYVITPYGTVIRLTGEWLRTSEFGDDDLTTEAALCLAARIHARQEREAETHRTRQLIGLIQTIKLPATTNG